MQKQLVDYNPHALVKAIAELLQIHPIDKRATVTLNGSNGMSWTGIPSNILESDSGQFVLLKTDNSDKICYVMLSQVVAVEVDNAKTLNSFLSKPWLQNSNYASMSKLQAVREMETLGQSLGGTQIKFQTDTLPPRADATEDALNWMAFLISTIQRMNTDPNAKEALSKIQLIDIKYAPGELKAQKNGSNITFQTGLDVAAFNQGKIEEQLNSIL